MDVVNLQPALGGLWGRQQEERKARKRGRERIEEVEGMGEARTGFWDEGE